LALNEVRDAPAPPLVQVASAAGGQPYAHLEPVRLDEVERSEQTVQTGQDAQRPPRLGEVIVAETLASGHPLVHVAREHQQRGPGVGERERRLEVLVALDVERCEIVGQVHQTGDLRQGLAAHDVDKLRRLLEEPGCRVVTVGNRRREIQRLGRRDQREHVPTLAEASCPSPRLPGAGAAHPG